MTFWVAGAAVAGAVISSDASRSASNKQGDASKAASAVEQRQYDQTRSDQAPYRATGNAALAQFGRLMGIGGGQDHSETNFNAGRYLELNPDAKEYMDTSGRSAYDHWVADGSRRTGDFWNAPDSASGGAGSPDYGSYAKPLTAAEVQMDPGYQFGQQQGQQAIDRKTAAAGGRISGASLKAAAEFGTDYATSGYSSAYNRVNQARTDRLNRLAALAGIGQTATQQVSNSGQNTANAVSNLVSAQGNASGAATMAQGNIWGGAGNQLAALYGRNNGSQASAPPTYYSQPAVYDDGYSVGQGSAYGGSRAGL